MHLLTNRISRGEVHWCSPRWVSMSWSVYRPAWKCRSGRCALGSTRGRGSATSRPGCAGRATTSRSLRRPRVARDVLRHRDGTQHPPTTGSAWEPTPWKAVQRAAARTLDRIERFGEAGW